MVVADSRYPMDGRFIEKVGTYNPMTEPKALNLDADKIKEWVKKGAKPTDTAQALIEKAGIDLKEVQSLYKELIEYLVKSLVDNKGAVVLTEAKEDTKTVITVKVDSKDMGRVIGKDGRIIKSIREIVRAYSAKNNDKVVVNIEE